MDRNERPFEARHPGGPSGASKTIYEPVVSFAQTDETRGFPDLLVSVDKLDLGWIRRWLSDYNDYKVAAP
jgi:hypothetical protein